MSEPFLGEVRMFCGNYPPNNWALCNGQLLAIRQYTALFSLLGIAYGGDGIQTFALPNLTDSVPMHQGQGPNLSPRTVGETGGESSVMLTEAEMAAHSHAPNAVSSAGDQASPENSRWSQSSTRDKQFGNTAPDKEMAADLLDPLGGGLPHENRAPFQVVNYIIALAGVFPQRP
jgi:microcystin-dependent protein